ncbi:ABC transporter ATP-binding protein [Actinomycetota bacterium]
MTTVRTDPIPAPANVGAPMLTASGVTKSYRAGKRDIEVLHGISLEARPGEMVAVMGPSGSGKSTLLYCLAGLEEPTGGEVALLGRPTRSTSRADLAKMRRSEVGFVFQSYNLVPTLTAYENVALPFRLRGDKPARTEIKSALEAVGLAELAESRPAVMSGGEQQRVALARVLAQRPRLLFADEPTGALDTRTGAMVLEELRRIAHDPERCVVTVTHDPGVAARCDRVLFLRDGELVEERGQVTREEVADLMAGLDATRRGNAESDR